MTSAAPPALEMSPSIVGCWATTASRPAPAVLSRSSTSSSAMICDESATSPATAVRARMAPGDDGVAQQQKIDGLISRAGGEAEVMMLRARADRWRRHMEERSRAARHQGVLLAYKSAPGVFRAQYYLDTIADMASDARVFISAFPTSGVRLNLEDVFDVAAIPTPPKPKEQ